jgi:hypothetical protein
MIWSGEGPVSRQAKLRGPSESLRNDAIFEQTSKRVIQEMRAEDLSARSSGVAARRGEIWFNGIVKDRQKPGVHEIRITTINSVTDTRE